MNPFHRIQVKISDLYTLPVITPRDVQRELDPERVEKMVEFQKDHFNRKGYIYNLGEITLFKQKSNGELLYLIDGQHRFEVFKQCQQLSPETLIHIVIIDNDVYQENIHEVFSLINTSVPVPNYLKNTMTKPKFQDFKPLIQVYKLYFSPNKKPQRPNVNVDQICEDLESSELFKDMDHNQMFEYFEFANKVFERTAKQTMSGMEITKLTKYNASKHLYLGFNRDFKLSDPQIFEAYQAGDQDFIIGAKQRTKRDKISKELRRIIWERDYGNVYKGKCKFCPKVSTESGFEVGHKVPFSKGGTEHPDNLFMICSECNKQMGNKSYEEFRR